MMRVRAGCVVVLTLATTCAAGAPRSPVSVPVAGEAIYLTGVLSDGTPLHGERAGMPGVEGVAAACTNCHRRSGLGEIEGRTLAPPVTARYLYHPRRGNRPGNLESAALTMTEPGARPELLRLWDRAAYTDASLARAIREGVGPDGQPLDRLMPRFTVDDRDMASLIAYVKQLSRRPSPGVGEGTLQFATVVTPDAAPERRRGMLDVLQQFFGPQNVFRTGQAPPLDVSHRFIASTRRWQLHIWELTGPAETWDSQLEERLQREPVFAVISGVGGSNWEPVHRFCQRSALPCVLPNVDLPVDAEEDFYNFYLSKGVLLEAELIGDRLCQAGQDGESVPARPRRLVQVYRRGDIGEQAAHRLRSAISESSGAGESIGFDIVDRGLAAASGALALREAVSEVRAGDALVLWLRPGDIASLSSQPPAAAHIFMSGIMAGLEQAPLGPSWRRIATMTYPFDLPERRRVRMNYPLGWMRFKGIPVVDERTQTDTWLACLVAAETVSMLGEDLVRDHFAETLETHLGTRVMNGYYPRLGLAVGQRFASKGGFLAHFAGAEGTHLVADGDWSVP